LSPVFNPAERRSYYSAQEEKVTAASMNWALVSVPPSSKHSSEMCSCNPLDNSVIHTQAACSLMHLYSYRLSWAPGSIKCRQHFVPHFWSSVTSWATYSVSRQSSSTFTGAHLTGRMENLALRPLLVFPCQVKIESMVMFLQ
jgi:hypothetical protein